MARISGLSNIFVLHLFVLVADLSHVAGEGRDSVIKDSVIHGIGSIFEAIGFSPVCVAHSLAVCEGKNDVETHLKNFTYNLYDSSRGTSQVYNNSYSEKAEKGNLRFRNCAEINESGDKKSGVRKLYTYPCCPEKSMRVYCDQETDGGGWTVFQQRVNIPIREDFFRKWTEYKIGFGNLTGEFWLGLDNIQTLVKEELMTLRIDMEDFENVKKFAKYNFFYISGPEDKYRLDLGSYSGDAGDAFSLHSGYRFSTKDQDNDVYGQNCASKFKGAWWYVKCHNSNLNGYYYQGKHDSHADGINWKLFKGHNYSLKKVSMKIRPLFEKKLEPNGKPGL